MKLKIVSWNCHYGLTEMKGKAKSFWDMYPDYDIYVIQECKQTDLDVFNFCDWGYRNWYGDDLDEKSNLGVAIFSKKYEIAFSNCFNRNFRYVIPYVVKVYEDLSINLFAVWTKSNKRGHFYYDENVTKAVEWYQKQDMLKNAIFIGDFNTFAKNLIDLKILEDNLINYNLTNCSVKSINYREKSTYFHNETSGYGIDDFCFVSNDLIDRVILSIPDGWNEKEAKSKRWKGLSDHCPISVEFNI